MKIEKRKRNIKNKSDCGETNYSKNFYSIFTRTIWHQIYFNFSQIKYLLSKKLRDRIKNRNAFDKNRNAFDKNYNFTWGIKFDIIIAEKFSLKFVWNWK